MIGRCFAALIAGMLMISTAAADEKFVRIGILGFDNYQGLAFSEVLNNPKAAGDLGGVKVTAVFPVTCPDYPESAALSQRWLDSITKWGEGSTHPLFKTYHPVEVVKSLDELLSKVDAVIMAGLDGNMHLAQAEPVLKAGKRLYVVRPLAANLADAFAILKISEQTGTPMFSCSQHRFVPGFIGMRQHPEVGKVLGCDVYGGFEVKGPQVDAFIRPLHSLETIYTIMGPGVETVSCTSTPTAESFTLVWKDGRVGTYRGIKDGALKYSATVFGDTGVSTAGVYGHGVPVRGIAPTKDKYMGYEGVATEIAKFFKGGPAPVSLDETREIFAVMQAAEQSRAQGGAKVSVADVLKSAMP
jgi:predicted dehydrogenase